MDPVKTGEAPRCPICGKYVGMLPKLPPIRVELKTWGNALGDLAFGPGDGFLVSDRFWRLYQATGFTGLINVSIVEVVRVKTGHTPPASAPLYRFCQVIRGRTAIDDAKSEVEREEPWTCQECRSNGIKRLKRVILEPNSWSGEDIFIARGMPGRILTTSRFKDFCTQNKISGCLLIPAEEYSFDHYPLEKA